MELAFTIDLKELVSEPAKKAKEGIEGLAVAMGRLIAPVRQGRDELGQFTKAVGPLDDKMKTLSHGIVAVAGGAIAVASALGGAAIEGGKLALEMGELKEQTVASLGAFSGNGEASLEMIDNLRGALGMTRAELVPLAKQLMSMGVQGADVAAQLKTVASAQALMGEEGGAEYLAILKKISGQAKISSKDLVNLAKTGVNVGDMASAMGLSVKQLQSGLKNGSIDASKFGAALQKAVTAKGADALAVQANSLGAQFGILKETVMGFFDSIDTKPFLDALKDLLSIFGKNTASGQAMGAGIKGTFDAIFKAAAKLLPYIKVGIEKFIIVALQAYIAVKKFFSPVQSGTQGVQRLAIVMGLLNGFVKYLQLSIGLLADTLVFAVTWIGKIAGALIDAIIAISNFGHAAYDAGSNFIDGLVGGIKAGVGKVVDAAKGVATGALDAVKGALGIHSPSTVMMQLGAHTAGGFAGGIAANTNAVESAAGGMSGAAASSAASGGASAPAGGGVTVNVEAGAIVINAAPGSSTTELTEDAITLLFERIALSQGLGQAA